jgi:hypothetical protein
VADEREAVQDAVGCAVAGLLVACTASIVMGHAYPAGRSTVALGAVGGWVPALLASLALVRRVPLAASAADRVTLARAVLASGCAAIAAMVSTGFVPARTWLLLGLAVPTLLLGAGQRFVARPSSSTSAASARLDLQLDGGVLVILSVAAAPVVGTWVLLVGALRYLFVAASRVRPSLRATLPTGAFRRTVAALQGPALVVVVAPFVPVRAATAVAAVALLLALVSLGGQALRLERHGRALRRGEYPLLSRAAEAPRRRRPRPGAARRRR